MNDLRFTFRQLLKNPGFTAVAVLTLALGIGANTAIFSFVNAILLRPLPYKDPERLVMVFENHAENGWLKNAVGAPVLAEWRKQSTAFEGLAARGGSTFILTGKSQPENIPGSRLSVNIFSLLGIKPMLGRDFLPEEETHGRHQVVMLSHELWQRRFGGDTNLLGQAIAINSEPHIVIGVMPPRTFFPKRNTQLWIPLAFSPGELRQRHAHNYNVYGRLKPGVTLAQARAEMDLIARRMAEADEQNKGWGAEVHPLHDILVGDSRRTLMVLLVSVGLVLLIGCANIANLLLARSAARAREFAIRAALGAGRAQMIRQLLTESLLLSVCGGTGGILIAALGLQALVRFSPPDLPRVWEGIHLDGWTLGFTVVVTLLTGLIFGLAPALQASSPTLASVLNEASRGSSVGRGRQRLRAALVVSEVALSLMLLVCAGLMIRSFGRLLAQDLGFVPEHVITMGLDLPGKNYPSHTAETRFYDALLARARALPGVQSAALVSGPPLGENQNHLSVLIRGAPPPKPGEAVAAGYTQASPGYFATLKIPLLQGRDFAEQDWTNTTPVVIVDETFVRKFHLGTNVLGRRIYIGDGTDNAEIIGVVKDIKRTGLADAPRGEMYRTYRQACWGSMDLVVRTQRDPTDITRAIRAELDGIDKDQPFDKVRTLTELVEANVAQRRLSVQLLGSFAGVAMLLAAIGLYGVLAYNVTQRTQEIGIRMALGAQRRNVLGLVLRQGMALVALGIALGLAGAFALTRVMRSLLFGIEPTDPLTFCLIPLLLAGVAFLACWLPARRATKVDPMEALRHE
jgi:putative ABC transport system permease protein